MQYREVVPDREFRCRLSYGADWREELERLASEADVTAGWLFAWGAVEDATLHYYDQDALEPRSVRFEEPLEVAVSTGSLAAGADGPEATVHAVLARPSGQALAGRLHRATVFAGEAYVRSFEGVFERETDAVTDLDLWL